MTKRASPPAPTRGKRDPAQSDRSIAKKANVSTPTVSAVRNEMADQGVKNLHPDVRIGSDGVAQPAKRKYTAAAGKSPRDDIGPRIVAAHVLTERDWSDLVRMFDEIEQCARVVDRWARRLLFERKRDEHEQAADVEAYCQRAIEHSGQALEHLAKFRIGFPKIAARFEAGVVQLLLEVHLPHIRQLLATAQNQLNYAMFPELRPGRKPGATITPRFQGYVATAIRELDGAGTQIKQLERWLDGQAIKAESERLVVNGIRLGRVDRAPGAKAPTFVFVVRKEDGHGTESRSQTRVALQDLLSRVNRDREEMAARDEFFARLRKDREP